MTAVHVHGVSKSFGGRAVLQGIELEVASGTLVTLLGPSGCGKTTLLRIVAGFEHADRGAVRFGGVDVAKVPTWERGIGFVFQNYALWPHLTVGENVAYGLRLQKRPGVEKAVQEALARVGLAGREDAQPGTLSGGQQQRVSLARALALNPRVLLLDEPLSNLDASLRVEMRREVRRLQSELGFTALYVTHDQDEALEISDVIAVMNRGVIEQLGTPEDIYFRPRTEFVAAFFGEVTFLRGQVVAERALTLSGGQRVETTAPLGAPGRSVVLAVRPADVRLGPATNGGWVGTVEQVFFLGGRRLVRLTAAGLTLHAHHPVPLRPGDQVDVTIAQHLELPPAT
ncbi:MAG: ABC transporter ATP-binding protein [Myxococcaceae bacterium]|nr:ABC transporter ATP-binding protein [Myxococcaceae bacterium]